MTNSLIRADGRRWDQARSVRITPGCQPYAEGSAMIEMGNTAILCAASVEEQVPRWMRGRGAGWVTAEYDMLPRATSSRRSRDRDSGRTASRSQEIQRLIGRSLRAATDLEALGVVVRVPMAGLRIGEQMAWLDRRVRNAEDADEPGPGDLLD